MKINFKKKITVKMLLSLISLDVLETLVHFCFKKSVLPEGDFYVSNLSDLAVFLKSAFFTPYLWLGFLSVLIIFIMWSTVLSKIDLSVAVPVCSFSYLLVPIVSIVFLGERVTMLRWVGIFFILAGVIFVSFSSQEKELSQP
ncbi:MAG: EamA family transporter [Candidatus Omnitrophota bacterium]